MTALDPLDLDEKPRGRFRKLPLGARIAIVVLGAIIGLNVLARFVSDSTGGSGSPSGRPSSPTAGGS